MYIWRWSERTWIRDEVERPELAEDEIRVAVSATWFDAGEHSSELSPGSSVAGRVIECGRAATQWDGRRVVAGGRQGCGECDLCRRGYPTSCQRSRHLGENRHGGLAQEVVLSARWALHLDERFEIKDADAALVAGPLLCLYTAMARSGLSSATRALLFAGGEQRDLAQRLFLGQGVRSLTLAGEALTDSEREDVSTWLEKGRDPEAPICVVVASEACAESAAQAITLCPAGSTLATLVPLALDGFPLFAKEWSVIHVPYGHPDLLIELMASVTSGDIELGDAFRVQHVDDLDAMSGPALVLHSSDTS